jgi:hypothetical protein
MWWKSEKGNFIFEAQVWEDMQNTAKHDPQSFSMGKVSH